MLTPEERRQVIVELADYLGPTGDVRQFVSTVFGPNRGDLLLEMPTSYNLIPDQAQFVVDHCLGSRWTVNPSLLELVLRRLVTQGGKADLASLRDRVQAKMDPNPNAYKTLWVLADQPFIDRRNLRVKLTELVEKVDRPILRVWGVRGSGKSYTGQLVDYVLDRARRDVHVASATLSNGNGPSYEAWELADALSVAFVPDEPIPPRQNSSYAAALCRWIVRNTLKKPGVWIYLLDGFGQPDVNDETRELLQLLTQQVCAPEFSRRLRVILLDFDKPPLPGNWRAKTLDDKLPEFPTIQEADVVDCLVEYNVRVLAEGRSQKAIKAAELSVLAGALVQRAAQLDPQEQFRKLYDELLGVAQVGD